MENGSVLGNEMWGKRILELVLLVDRGSPGGADSYNTRLGTGLATQRRRSPACDSDPDLQARGLRYIWLQLSPFFHAPAGWKL